MALLRSVSVAPLAPHRAPALGVRVEIEGKVGQLGWKVVWSEAKGGVEVQGVRVSMVRTG